MISCADRHRLARMVAKQVFKDHKAPGLDFKPALKTEPVDAVQIDEPFEVETLEGTMKGKADDYLMKGVEGELYICDKDIFDKTYEWKKASVPRYWQGIMSLSEVPVRFLRVMEPYEIQIGGKTYVDLTAWESANSHPEVTRWFQELRRTGKLASRIHIARHVAERHVTAGVFQAPPKMVESITHLAMGAVAALELDEVEKQIDHWSSAHKDAKQQVKSFGSVARNASQVITDAPGVRKEYLAYLEAVEHPAARSVAGYGGGRLTPVKQGEFSSLRKSGDLVEWWARERASIEERQGWWLDGMKTSLDENRDKRKQLQKYLRSNVAPKTDQIITVPVDLSEWRYGDIAGKLDQARDKQVQEFTQALQKAHETGFGVDLVKDLIDAAKTTWKSIRVNLVVEMRLQSAVGMWNPVTKTLTVKLPRRLDQLGDVRTTIRHELQHMAQTLMTDAIKGFNYRGTGAAGMPSKRIQTPEFNQTQNESFIEQDPQRYPKAERDKAIRRLMNMGVDRHYLRSFNFHTVDDVEFVTRLADDIETFQSMVKDKAVNDLKAAIRVFTFSSTSTTDRGDAGPLVSPSVFFRNLKLAARDKWKEAVKQFVKAVL